MPGDLVETLYVAPPDTFVAVRSAAVEAAKRAGDKDLARQIAALKKPTVAAWLVNVLAWRAPEELAELAELATALRRAQRELDGDELRELSTERRRVVSALVTRARELAVAEDPSAAAAKLPLADVEHTLTAALADPDIAEQVRSGRLIRSVSYAGFGEVPRPRLRLVGDDELPSAPAPSATHPAATVQQPPPDRVEQDAPQREQRRERAARRRALDRELTAARTAEGRARQQLERADAAERDAAHAVAEIEAELAALEQRRAAAVAEVSQRKLARRAAQRDATAARRRVGDVEAALEALDRG
ncbi:MAG TPA: hypothetical protein VFO77_15745 [Actinoplanes sp.]|nr:hypothetical protein [Actinoplanes sp.]